MAEGQALILPETSHSAMKHKIYLREGEIVSGCGDCNANTSKFHCSFPPLALVGKVLQKTLIISYNFHWAYICWIYSDLSLTVWEHTMSYLT